MILLDSMLGKARSWLGATPTPTAARDAVRANRFEAALFQEVLEDAPHLQSLVTELNVRYDYTEDLMRDTLLQFYQGDPMVRARPEMDPGYLTNHAVATNLASLPQTAATRQFTKHSKYGAAMAAISVGGSIKEFLAENKELEEAAKAADQAQQALAQQQQDLQQACQGGEGAADQLAAAMGDFDGNGPLTAAQAQAQASADTAAGTVEAALQTAEQAQQIAEQAQQAAGEAADTAKQALRGPVANGVGKAHDQLAEEAALFRGWGISDGQVARMDFTERAQLAQRLRSHRLSKYIKELGRWRVMGQVQRAKRITPARDEVYDVELSGRLPDMLASELPLLATEPGRLDFLIRLAENRLLSKKYRGVELVGQGAIICCVDTSASMKKADQHGLPRELFAKGLALTMLDQARTEHRDFVGIIFANERNQRVFHFPKGEGAIEDVLAFTELFFAGGTSFEQPLDLAMDVLEQQFSAEHKAKGDIVLVTDDECAVSVPWMRTFQARKERLGFRVFGMALGMEQPGSTLDALSDNVRSVNDFIDPSVVADVVRAI